MAKQNTPQIRARNENKVILKGLHDEIIMETGSNEYTIKDSSGALIRRNISESVQLASNELWHPGMMKTMPVGICVICRRKKRSHGISSLRQSVNCVKCGLLLCTSCRRQGLDNLWRCPRHHRLHILKTTLRAIFMRRKDSHVS